MQKLSSTIKEYSIILFFLIKYSYLFLIFLFKILLIFIYLPASFVLFLLNYRIVNIYVRRLGHLATDTSLLIKAKEINQDKYKIIVLFESKVAANNHLLKYLSRDVQFIKNQYLKLIFIPFTWIKYNTLDSNNTTSISSSKLHPILNSWKERDPLYSLDSDDREVLETFFKNNFPENKYRFHICLFARESGYSLELEGHDYDQSYRNIDIDSYDLAIAEIQKRGGICVRLGDKSMKKIENNSFLIDYANSEYKCPQLDIALIASSKFVLASLSGIVDLANLFGVPAAVNNISPFSHCPIGIGSNICIPKLYKKDQKLIKINEIFDSKISNYRYLEDFKKDGITLINNTQDEIKDLTIEMFNKLDEERNLNDNEENIYSNKFKSMINEQHFSYLCEASVSETFLSNHKNLLN